MAALQDIYLKGGRVLDPSRRYDAVGNVLLRHGKIEAVGATVKPPAGAQIIDGEEIRHLRPRRDRLP